MYAILLILWALAGTAAFWIYLSKQWERFDSLTLTIIQQQAAFYPVPGAEKYMDLKFSLLRHAFVFVVSAVLIKVIPVFIVGMIIFVGNTWYFVSAFLRYNARKKIVESAKREHEPAAEYLEMVVGDSGAVVLYSLFSVAILFVLYAIA